MRSAAPAAAVDSWSTASPLPCTDRVGLTRAVSDMWTAVEDDPRTYGNPIGEKSTYREYLGNYRLTIAMKCDGLDADQLARRSVPPSTLSLLGLVRHLAQMENHWFQRVLQGGPPHRACISARTTPIGTSGARPLTPPWSRTRS